MPTQPTIIKTFSGPWKGVEMRDAYQTDQHLELAINVNLSRGYLEPRPGKHLMCHLDTFSRSSNTTSSDNYLDNIGKFTNPRIHVVERPVSDSYAIIVGTYVDNADYGAGHSDITRIGVHVINLSKNRTSNTHVFPLENDGEPYDQEFTCSFVDTFLPGGRPATLICTDTQVYVFTPDVAEHPHNAGHDIYNNMKQTGNVRRASVRYEDSNGFKSGFDAVQNYKKMFAYAENTPPGSIAEAHGGMVFYAGFNGHKSLTFQSKIDNSTTNNPAHIEPDGDNLPVTMIDNAYSVRLGKHMFLWSDINDPLAINETSFGTVDYGQEITGLKSYNDVLVIFTRRSTYGFVGGIDPKTSKVWKMSDIGCTAPNTPVVAGEKLFWINDNGIWASDGPKTMRISDPIGALFSDELEPQHTPNMLTGPEISDYYNITNAGDFGLAAGLGYPWKIDKKLLHLATSCHNPVHNQLWFNVPIKSSLRYEDTMGDVYSGSQFAYGTHINCLTIVYDYELDAFTFYVSGNFSFSNFCSDAAYWSKQNKMLIASITTMRHSNEGDDAGEIQAALETFPHEGQDFATPHYGEAWTAADGGGVSAMDYFFKLAKRSVPYAWCSARLFKNNADYIDVRRPRITMLATGHRPKRYMHTTSGLQTNDWGPLWFIETEDAAFGEWKDNNDASTGISETDALGDQGGFLQCHPRAYDSIHSPGDLNKAAEERAQPAYFWGGVNSLGGNGDLNYAKWDAGSDSRPDADTMVWGSKDWFTQKLYYPEGNLAGRSIRIGVFFPEWWYSAAATQGSIDNSNPPPPPVGTVASFSFEVQRQETTR